MVLRDGRRPLDCVLVDLNTQRDFLGEEGALLVPNASALVASLRRVIAWAKRNAVPVISSIESHRVDEVFPEALPPHCVDGTNGQRKLLFTVFKSHVRVEGDSTLSVPLDLFQRYQQVIFRKRSRDLFNNPKADRFITQLRTREFVLFGVPLERTVRDLAIGLISRSRRVTVVVDCCGYWNAADSELALRQLTAKGARLVTTDDLVVRRVRRIHRYRPPANAAHGPDHGNGRHRSPARPGSNGRVPRIR